MKILARILPADKKASDGSYFPKNVILEYLDSPQYHFRMRSRTCLGAVTHAYRDKDLVRSKVIAVLDEMLLNRIITHYVEEMWFENGWLMGNIVLLNPDVIEEPEATRWIKYVRGLVMNGIEIPVSAFVAGIWNGDKCEKIVDIAGVDFTLDPGFEGASIILDKSRIKEESLENKAHSKTYSRLHIKRKSI